MKLPIPNDRTNDAWHCVQIDWPDSPLWNALLRGWLSQMMRGRTYDETTGSILDTMAIGREIWARNEIFRSCDGSETPGAAAEQAPIIAGDWFGEDEESEMGCGFCYRYTEAGIMEILVCGEWVPVILGSIVPPIETEGDVSDPDTPQPEDDDEVDLNIKCRSAYMIARAMWRVHEKLIDHVDDVVSVPFIGDLVAGELPEYTLSKVQLSYAVGSLIAASVTLDLDIVFATEAEYVPDMAAYLSKFMPTVYSLNSAEYNLAAASLVFYSFHEGIEINLGQFVEGDYWAHIFRALGRGTINDLMARGRQLDATEFDCHERVLFDPGTVLDVIWTSYVEELTTLANGQDGAMTTVLANNRLKLNINWAGTGSEGSTDNTTIFGVDCAVDVKSITLRFEGNPPTSEWDTGDVINWSNISRGEFQGMAGGVTQSWVATPGAGFCDFTCTFSVPAKPTRWGYYDSHSARWLGQSAPNPFDRDHSVTITGVTYT